MLSVFKKLIFCFTFLLLMLVMRAQVPVTSGGEGQTNQNPHNEAHGGAATGLGCGGGGANFYGGNGGDGLLGGGGGGAAGFTVSNMVGGKGGNGNLVVASYIGAAFFKTEVYVNGTSLTIEPSVTSVKVWAIGAGGGGAGSTSNDGTSGGGGGAGGVAYITSAVTAGDIITYSLGAGGTGGVDVNNGSDGGNTSATIGPSTITGLGGQGGRYNTNVDASGGTFIGGDGGAIGGIGKGISGDNGGGGGGSIGGGPGGIPSSVGGNGANSVDISGLFAALSSASILPITWKNFTVVNQKANALLLWETSYELDVSGFTVQYSTDGIRFNNIGTVPAANSLTGHTYQYVHQTPARGNGYYRVYQSGVDGKNTYSKTLKNTNTFAGEKNMTITGGNVVYGSIKFQLSNAAAVNLMGFDGKLISTKFFEKGNHELNVSDLKAGYYILSSANETQRILVQ